MPAANKKAAPPLSSRSAPAKAPAASGPPSKKRKMDSGEQKYYAVRAGFKPGVYTDWGICQQQISGFKGAVFKSFLSYEDASAFAAGRDPPSASNDKPNRFYGVAIGRKPGVYTDWTKAQQAIVGWKGPKYKKFETFAEAQAFVRSFGTAAMAKPDAGDSEGDDGDDVDEQPPAKKAKSTKSTETAKSKSLASDATVVYTDGSSLGNGRLGASAGVGVYFGPGDSRNISERLKGEIQTNQRAELTAVLRTLEVLGDKQPVEIRTDSKYSIQCVTEWFANWQRNGWKSRDGPVKNQDLIKAIRERLDARDKLRTPYKLTWVKGHAEDPGNIAADQLAVAGARITAL